MSEKVYKLYMARPKEAWFQLTPEEQNEFISKNRIKQKELGVKEIVFCDSSWSSEEWRVFGLEEYDDMEKVKAYTAFLNELNWFRYLESKILLGTRTQM